jgi:hypothetical protein
MCVSCEFEYIRSGSFQVASATHGFLENHTLLYVCVYMYVCMRVCVCVYIYIYIYILHQHSLYVCIMYMYIYYVYTSHTHTHTHTHVYTHTHITEHIPCTKAPLHSVSQRPGKYQRSPYTQYKCFSRQYQWRQHNCTL